MDRIKFEQIRFITLQILKNNQCLEGRNWKKTLDGINEILQVFNPQLKILHNLNIISFTRLLQYCTYEDLEKILQGMNPEKTYSIESRESLDELLEDLREDMKELDQAQEQESARELYEHIKKSVVQMTYIICSTDTEIFMYEEV